MVWHRSRLFVWIAGAAALLGAGPAPAQMIPVAAYREVRVRINFPGGPPIGGSQALISESFDPWPSGPLTWHREILDECEPGSPDLCPVTTADAFADHTSQFFPAAINMSGEGSGAWAGEGLGEYGFLSMGRFRFRVDTPFDYELHAAVDPGTWPSLGQVGGHVALLGADSTITIHYTQFGFLDATGRLPAGEYVLEGISDSHGLQSEPYLQGATYSAVWIVNPVNDSLIVSHPLDQTVGCGGTATFSVGAAGPPGSVTYQWMRNFQPLTNGSGISGATGPTLTIQNACTAQAGYYNVVLTLVGTNPPVQVPSRLAQLSVVTTTTGVEEDPVTSSRASMLASASPNPFRASTGIRYSVPSSARLRAKVYDARGAEVRTLEDRIVSGSGTLTWDGRTRTGARAPAGIYFVRVDAGDVKESRKVVLLP